MDAYGATYVTRLRIMSGMFEGFTRFDIDLGDVRFRGRMGGSGSPLLLLHGFPQTHFHWHALAPLLAKNHTVIAPDLPGYGDSIGPAIDETHFAYSKRNMANQMIRLMENFDFNTFHLAGHDRGARVAYRLALDHPERVRKLVSFDTVPTLDIWEAMDWAAAIDAFHWPLLSQPHPVPETLIGADPAFFLQHLIERWVGAGRRLHPKAMEEYVRCIQEPSVVSAMCEDYRAGAMVDIEHDRKDRADGTRITCPLLVLRGTDYQPDFLRPTWDLWADDVIEQGYDCGHFLAEELPDECAEAMLQFFELGDLNLFGADISIHATKGLFVGTVDS